MRRTERARWLRLVDSLSELNQFSKEGGVVTLADSVETLGVDLRTKEKSLGVKKSEEEEMQGEVLTHKKISHAQRIT